MYWTDATWGRNEYASKYGKWLVSKLGVDCVKFGRGKKSDMPVRHEIEIQLSSRPEKHEVPPRLNNPTAGKLLSTRKVGVNKVLDLICWITGVDASRALQLTKPSTSSGVWTPLRTRSCRIGYAAVHSRGVGLGVIQQECPVVRIGELFECYLGRHRTGMWKQSRATASPH
jgi:hypothetical protein